MPEKKPAPDLDALLKYREMRNFAQTPEPDAGAPPAESRDLTFVVQQHRATRMHWDFRLEVDGVLWSWPIPRGPSLNPKDKRMAVRTEDHPFDYGGFEGAIPKGNYGAGEVIVWDNGTYTPDEKGIYSWGDKGEGSRRMHEGLAAGKISVFLRGKKLRGSFTLVKLKNQRGKTDDWLFIKHRDEYASDRDILQEDKSVISGLSIKDLQEGRMPALAHRDGEPPHPVARQAPFPDAKTLRPMLPTLVDRAFSRAGWLFEPKLDGVRTLAFLRDGAVELRTRRGNVATKQYPEVCEGVQAQPVRAAVFDGEIVATDETGVPDFQELQARINLSRQDDIDRAMAETPVCYYVFDLLYLDGWDLTKVPASERKALLWRTLEQGGHVRYVDHVEDDGLAMHEGSAALGFEGIVAKNASTPYEPDVRTRSWLKVKDVTQQEFVVGGFTEGEGSRAKTFGGLLVGYYDGDGALQFAGSVGSGLTDSMLTKIRTRLDRLRTETSPFATMPQHVGSRWGPGKPLARCMWVRPEVVVQVKFASWTREGFLRAPVFLGVREDIEPRSVRREDAARQSVVDVVDQAEPSPPATGDEIGDIVRSVCEQLDAVEKDNIVIDVGGAPIKVTNLSKEFWPATREHPARTKRELIRYYARVAPFILPHLRDRPLTLTRYPNGVNTKGFYQKHWPQPFPSEFHVDRVRLYSSQNDEDQEYILCNNVQTLIWLAQLADLEMHVWMARVNPEPDGHDIPLTFTGSEENLENSLLNYPDFVVFDLDPYIYAGTEKKGEEPALNRRAFEKTREIAFDLKELLQQLRLSSFIKTTGKTGLHIYVPVLRQYNYDEIRAAAEAVGRYMLQVRPDELTMEWATQKRTGKIFFDHNQNTRGKTLASQYSLRPSSNAGVSMPITWEELPRVYPTDFDIDTAPARLEQRGDTWSNILDAKQDLRALIDGVAR
jgi:bifunctional non-homologous end joining protein LigD